MSAKIIDATKLSDIAVRKLLSTRPGEKVLIVADYQSMLENYEIIYSLIGEVSAVGAEATLAVMPDRKPGNEVLTDPIENAVQGANIVIGITKTTGAPLRSPTVVNLVKKKRIRVLCMVKRGWEDFTSAAVLEADYEEILDIANRLRKAGRGKRIRITSNLGTNFTASIEGRKWGLDGGFAHDLGEVSNIIWGEVDIGPVESTSKGIVVVEGPITHLGAPPEPIKITVDEGRVVEVEGGKGIGDALAGIVKNIENADNIAEIGLGINPKARRRIGLRTGPQQQQEDKKALGTVHIAIGDGTLYGQSVYAQVHMDMMMYYPTIQIDGKTIVEAGKLKV